MSSAGFKGMDIFLGRTMLGVCALDTPARWFEVADAFEGWDKALHEIESMAGKRKARLRVRVWLSGALARPFMLRALPGLTRARDALKVAETTCAEATGLNGACRVWLDAWVKERECLAVAVEQSLVDAIEEGAAQRKIMLECLRPWWGEALGASLNLTERPSLLAIDDGEALTVFGGSEDGFTTAVGYGSANAEQISAIMSRAMLTGERENACAVLARIDKSDDASLPESKLEAVFGARWERLK